MDRLEFLKRLGVLTVGASLMGSGVSAMAAEAEEIPEIAAEKKIKTKMPEMDAGLSKPVTVMVIGAGISIFTVENLEFVNIITDGAKELSYYPLNIYNKWLSGIFTFVIPVACFNYLPISYIMGYGNLPSIVYALSPLFGMLFLIPCFVFFILTLKKRYQSTGT